MPFDGVTVAVLDTLFDEAGSTISVAYVTVSSCLPRSAGSVKLSLLLLGSTSPVATVFPAASVTV